MLESFAYPLAQVTDQLYEFRRCWAGLAELTPEEMNVYESAMMNLGNVYILFHNGV